MIPTNYVPTPSHLRSERTKAAEAVVAEYLDGKTKLSAFDPLDENQKGPFIAYVDELNAFLRSRGFDDYRVARGPRTGELSLLAQPQSEFEMRGPSVPRPEWAK